MNERTRAYVYRVLTALAPIVVFYGVVSDQEAALFLAAAATILSTGLAAVNTSTKP